MAPQHTFHAETAADRDTAIIHAASNHLATLDHLLDLTDDFCGRNRIKTLLRKVKEAAACGDLAALGRNGMGPEIDMLARRAAVRLTDTRVSRCGTKVAA